MEIVINACFGGFGLSSKAIKRYLELKNKECHFYTYKFCGNKVESFQKVDELQIKLGMSLIISTKDLGLEISEIPNEFYFAKYEINRTDNNLIQVIKELGKEANDKFAELKIVTIPDNVKWEITEGDGMECIEEIHRKWN